ncbi:MAG: uncharacterized protein KVP18_002493 [Porospora cf. gigantea A]|uniref:uncharacterized protein n=1 Tax=Porospora cf. gigantea A TaxID=2853593 RepID=UPI003559BAE6|nr:MAG: hypothetical protein KVP18_002493 [Porospora cf. gigantea A]
MTPEIEDEAEKVLAASREMPEFWKRKYEAEFVRNWDIFYKNTGSGFWPDRAWLQREFNELKPNGLPRLMVEIGCGVGSTLFPSLMLNKDLIAGAYDCSPRAVEFVKQRWASLMSQGIERDSDLGCILEKETPDINPFVPWSGGRLLDAAVWDITKPMPSSSLTALQTARAVESTQVADIVMCVFVVSALPLSEQAEAVRRLAGLLVPGGVIIFRDYGRYDDKQLKLARHRIPKKVRDNCFARQDGTLQTYFTCDEVEALFTGAGLRTIENGKFLREFNGVKRVWIQSRFQKPTDGM